MSRLESDWKQFQENIQDPKYSLKHVRSLENFAIRPCNHSVEKFFICIRKYFLQCKEIVESFHLGKMFLITNPLSLVRDALIKLNVHLLSKTRVHNRPGSSLKPFYIFSLLNNEIEFDI